MEAHGIPKVNLVAAGVGVSDTLGLLVFPDACSRGCHKAAMMPAVAPQPIRRPAQSQKDAALAEAQVGARGGGPGIRPEAHIGAAAAVFRLWTGRVAPAKKTPSLLSKPRDADAFVRPIAHQERVHAAARRAARL